MKINSVVKMSSSRSSTQKVVCAEICGQRLEQNVNMMELTICPPPSFKLNLPSGSSSVDNLKYHTIDIPAVDPLQRDESRKLIPQLITKDRIDHEHRTAFHDVKSLNLIQSATFDVAYRSYENMLVCAPTGAGKTLIALLCILHELHNFKSVAEFKKTPYKIVYIAPMKALAGEIVNNLKGRLKALNLTVKEFTGDVHLRAHEIHETDILVTTPEKWDTVTRRSTGNESLFRLVQLMIIDEIHLLNCDRGPVLEAIIARTFGLRDNQNSRLRVIGLSATLPNYKEIADFMHVNHSKGLFYFNWGFRPVPLKTTFVGSKNYRFEKHWEIEDRICYNKTVELLKKRQKVLIFVLSRAKAVNTACFIEKQAVSECDTQWFNQKHDEKYIRGLEILEGSNMKILKRLYEYNISCHHAGMLREDRIRVEELFRDGYIDVLVSTTTLAWGVNLPAYGVIIKGTRYYNPARSSQTEIDLLEAQQMFGRAGRPQYDTMGEATLITNQINLPYYLSLFHWSIPIQSHLIESLADHFNAEIALKTISNISDGVKWLTRTFLYVRMVNQPDYYNVQNGDIEGKCRQILIDAANNLVKAGMIIFDSATGTIESTNIGEVASHTYINRATIQIINTELKDTMNFDEVIFALCKSKEYDQIKVRPSESRELSTLITSVDRSLLKSYITVESRKMAVLIYSFMMRTEIVDIQLYLDQIYIVQDARRILRAYFDIAVIKRFSSVAHQITMLQKCLEHKCFIGQHILQFKKLNISLDSKHFALLSKYPLKTLKILDLHQLECIVTSKSLANRVYNWIQSLPFVKSTFTCVRMTPTFIRVNVKVTPDFEWDENNNCKDNQEPWVMWVLNPLTKEMFPPKRFSINRRHVERNETLEMDMNILLNENDPNIPDELILHLESEVWLGVEIDHKLPKSSFLPTGAQSNFL